jgi:hypothetical protein
LQTSSINVLVAKLSGSNSRYASKLSRIGIT